MIAGTYTLELYKAIAAALIGRGRKLYTTVMFVFFRFECTDVLVTGTSVDHDGIMSRSYNARLSYGRRQGSISRGSCDKAEGNGAEVIPGASISPGVGSWSGGQPLWNRSQYFSS